MNLTAVIHRWSLGLVVGLALSFVCNSSSAAPGPALDFESSTHWSLREGAGPISLSAEASSGEHSLEVGGSGWRRIGSIPLSTVGAQENTVWLDVEPTHVPQAWEGVGVVLRIGSLQLWWADLGTNSIHGLIPGEFSTLAFTLPEAVRSQLNASYADLEVLIAVNSAAPVRFDHLRFSSQAAPGEEMGTPPDAGSPASVCDPDRSDLQVTAVDGDLKDLWAGREEP
ncbi:MAG TPA: hypothetical protein VN764_12960 [Polyangiaceae bacterium]|nr:hypothetical protein [Polyangiaceae bacterium]